MLSLESILGEEHVMSTVSFICETEVKEEENDEEEGLFLISKKISL